MENIIITLCLIFSMVITYVIGFDNYKNIMKELEKRNKCEDDKCCGCKYCNKNK